MGETDGNMDVVRLTVVVGRSSSTIDGVVRRINGLLGKSIESPRDDIVGPVEVYNIVSVDIVKVSQESYYGSAVVEVGIRKETIDVEKEFFSAIKDKT